MKKYVIFKNLYGIKGTTEDNYNNNIQNAKLIQDFKNFDNIEDVKNYIIKYFGYKTEDIIIIK